MKQFLKHRLGLAALLIVLLFCLVGVYAPLFASSKPLFVIYDGEAYFPLFRYMFYRGFYTKGLDLFFNALMVTLPFFALFIVLKYWRAIALLSLMQVLFFFYLLWGPVTDPQRGLQESKTSEIWSDELKNLSPYGRLNQVVKFRLEKEQQSRLEKFQPAYNELLMQKTGKGGLMPTLWNLRRVHYQEALVRLENAQTPDARREKAYLVDRHEWLIAESEKLTVMLMPFISHFHWQDDAGGSQTLNQVVDWRDLSRINRKDLVASLIFGIRISMMVGIISVSIAFIIGTPIGALAGFYGGTFDIITSRLLEIWESMPTFFMLLLVVAMLQSKSIFLVISVIGLFGWTGFSRYVRGEFFKQRSLPYVEACHAQGFSHGYTIFRHILPNAIPPLLTLLPFAVMGAITSEAGLSFLGLGEEGSCSWGVLMDEGRAAFPGESYLLWPPALLLTILLVAIALMGDALRDALDPKMRAE